MKRIVREHQFKFTASVILLPLVFVFAMWLVFWVEMKFNVNFHHYGIYPREWFGLKGVLLSPFLHSDFQHITNNSLALLVLLAMLQYFYKAQTVAVLFLGILFSGFGTWLLGRPSYHIGASGLIYVLVSFIFFKGIFTKYYRLMAVSFVVVLLYGGMVWYMFPEVDQSVSWEGHLSGFLTGLSMALLIKTPQFGKPMHYEWEHPDFNPEKDKFMRNFDENGNFNPPPKIVLAEEEDSLKNYFSSSIKVIYEFLGFKKETKR
ncbi:rhomboid family intramembrane serine protease [Flavobacterium sediminis]|uniref:Rhomboid family intramembrane serine protease n=1 Tax=Flavobacterium sediminis TaxID=2201181 RepID=A0A2U8QSJ3_9FLAO|nr:rhomboid family intramembrane serine protease [Flavobacterium sediminis]AWM13137.1 rhomboid family intramembrane serine protease [Flavobacterium sediminis]